MRLFLPAAIAVAVIAALAFVVFGAGAQGRPTAIATATVFPSPTASATLSPTPTASPTPTLTPTVAAKLLETATPTAASALSATATPSQTPLPTVVAASAESATATASSTPSASPSASATPSPSPAPTATATASPTATATVTPQTTAQQPASTGLSAVEARLLELHNQARRDAGLTPLKLDPLLEKVARSRATDMATRHYFSHTNPDGVSWLQVLQQAGYVYTFAGENLHVNNLPIDQSADNAHASLMSSPEHREHILSPNFTYVGVGEADDGEGRHFFAIEFAAK